MPRDIRSYFSSAKTNTTSVSTKTAKRRRLSSDEDDVEILSPVKLSKKTKKLGNNSVSPVSDENAKEKKVVTPTAKFGKKPISRQEAPKILKQLQKEEAKSHNDDDFECTLIELDTSDIEQKYLTETKSDKDPFCSKRKEDDIHTISAGNKKEEKTPIKKKDNVKKKETPEKSNVDRTNKTSELKNKKHSNDSSSKDIEIYKHDNKSKNVEKPSIPKVGISKIEIKHEEPKRKVSPKKTEVLDVYEERIERKKHNAARYQQYLQRGGARHPGSKKVPEGAEYCLAGLSFVITGVLDSLEREEADELIKHYGGRIVHQVSKKTNYIIIGDQPGPAKVAKATNLNVKQISEDDLLEMIRTRPAGQADNVTQLRTKSNDRTKCKSTESEDMSPSPPKKIKNMANEKTEKLTKSSPRKKEHTNKVTEISKKIHSPDSKKYCDEPIKKTSRSPSKKKHDVKDTTKVANIAPPIEKEQTEINEPLIENKIETNDAKHVQKETDSLQYVDSMSDINGNISTQALVEKYRPKTMKQILGQQGDKSNAKKLHKWLMNWHKNHSGHVKHVKPSPWAKSDDGAFFKAALLSGPPGIGKTTTVQVVCNELGFDLVEFNASDTRSKKLLQQEVSELLSNTSLKDYFKDTKHKPSLNHVLLMDEVDGMAGNEDRGGLQELISLIKSTEVPIVCICNDRNNPKMKTLSNYVFDLRFMKPRLEQIRGAMKSICFKEHINISTEDLDRLIESTNQDIRQVINHLAMFVEKTGCQEKSEKRHVNKDLKLGPWDVVKKVFSAEEHKHMNIHEKSDLFFHDYNIASLFVQENYLLVTPQGSKNKLLEKVAESAESLALGDIVEKSIRSNGAWSLLPMQACYSSVIPGTVMSGYINSQINFPSWLGRNSRANKFDRLAQEITVHTRLTTGVSKEAIKLDYIKPLRDAVLRPLAVDGTQGVDTAVNVMNHYHLIREDLDSLLEISLWPGDRDPMQVIDTKVKAAFTRACNKNLAAVPYTVSGTSKKKVGQQSETYLEEEETAEVNSDDDNDDNVETDKMIKAKKPASKKTASKDKSNDKTQTKGKSIKASKRGKGHGKTK
ncbi:replication factor C subunit 1 [Hylaeus volcanicus]|uniref:replication factor C subunit 1 n=1 Tax=Hylaeus volcanicus TaxID=313075 RepID=UPI0023B81778|nr:replication factor C subunit 1 [Hylaeus volcanicus]